MRGEEDYMDQLFKDHFEDFAKSPGEGVWKGVVANGTMANGKKLGYPSYWKLGLLLGLGLFLTFGILQGYQMLDREEGTENLATEESQRQNGETEKSTFATQLGTKDVSGIPPKPTEVVAKSGQDENEETVEEASNYLITDGSRESSVQGKSNVGTPNSSFTSEQRRSSDIDISDGESVKPDSERTGMVNSSEFSYTTNSTIHHSLGAEMLRLNHLKKKPGQAAWARFNEPLSMKVRRDMARSWMMEAQGDQKIKGGHWFVSGAFVADASLESDKKFILGLDGLAFGAGKYLTPDSFIEISLRGAWSNGFNMRATYARLFLPGRLRPYVQGGVAWGERVGLRMGLGLLYTPEKFDKWRFYVAANYESSFNFSERSAGEAGVFEIGAQIRLSGTERVLSDNNWMNSVPLYELPTGWYADASVSFSFDEKTKVVDYSAYIGRYLKRRLFIRGGVRVDRDDIALPVQVQYHFLVRKQLRFGAYTGASLEIQNTRLGAELGFIAYYEVKPGLSLFVAPVILEGSSYTERLFETGIQLNLAKKK